MQPTAAPLPVQDELAARVHKALEANPRAMTGMLANQLGVPEREVVRRLPHGQALELNASKALDLIRAFEPLGKVHVIVNTGTVVLEAFGQFGGFSQTGPFFNVQTDSLDMHIRHQGLHTVFAVVKQSHMDGVPTLSIQFFTPEGGAVFKVFLTFGGKDPSSERQAQFEELKTRFRA